MSLNLNIQLLLTTEIFKQSSIVVERVGYWAPEFKGCPLEFNFPIEISY